jgi:hypothetical protein
MVDGGGTRARRARTYVATAGGRPRTSSCVRACGYVCTWHARALAVHTGEVFGRDDRRQPPSRPAGRRAEARELAWPAGRLASLAASKCTSRRGRCHRHPKLAS